MPPPEKPLPRPTPKPRPKRPAEAKPMPARPPREPAERDGTPAGVPFLQQPFACETYRLCPPPPAPPATLHLRSGRLPTPLLAVSATLLGLSALLLLALLVRWLVRRRRRGQPQDEAPLALEEDDEESVMGVDSTAGWEGEEEEVDSGAGDGDGVHHVWFIRTKGLDERAIAAIAAVVYDSSAKTKRGDDGSCAVCLAEFRDGETLRLLPRCGHAFHRACIDTWLRAHVNCPLCRAPVQVAGAAKSNAASGTASAAARSRGEDVSASNLGGARTEEAERSVLQERAVRRAASMMALPRREWPEASPQAPASTSAREEDMTGLTKIRRLLKFSDMAGIGAGRPASFGAGGCQGVPTTTRSGPSTATGANGDEIESSR